MQHMVESVKKMSSYDLLNDRERTPDKDPHAIFVCTWHPKLRGLSSVLDKNYEILKNDPALSKIFDKKPIVAFRRKRNLRNILCKNDVREKNFEKQETKNCKGCQVCKIMTKKRCRC